MRWCPEFVRLVLRFADTAAQIGELSIDEALLGWTPLYLNLGLNRSFDPQHPVWQEFLTGYHRAPDPVAWTYSYYLAHAEEYDVAPHGCFSYRHETETRTIRFHFYGDRNTSGISPLSLQREPMRRQELTAMFTDIHRDAPEAEMVRGRSWMYNLPAYCRLFPPEYVRSAVSIYPELQFMSLWGQFITRDWQLRETSARRLLAAAEAASTLDELAASFPLPVLAPRCSIHHFYAFYGIG